VPEPEKISKYKDWARSKLWFYTRNKHLRYMFDNNLIEKQVGVTRPMTPKKFIKNYNEKMTDEE
jgi:hypothetical protein